MSKLSDVLKAANVEKFSTRAIAAAAERAGHPIDYSTVSLYLNGKHGKPDEATLVALAAVLPVSVVELREAAGLPAESVEPYSPPSEAARLTKRQRDAVDEIIRLLVKAGEGDAPPMTFEGDPDPKVAALDLSQSERSTHPPESAEPHQEKRR